MRRAGLLYMLAGVLILVAFFLPAAGGPWSLWDTIRGVGTIHDRLAVLEFLPLNVVLRLVQIAIVLIAIVGINFVLFGLGMVRLGVVSPGRPDVAVAAWCALGIPVAMTIMSWPEHPSLAGIVFFAAGVTAVSAGFLASRSSQASPS